MLVESLFGRDEPIFIISVAARMLGVRTQTLRYYESIGLVEPARSKGNQRVYSQNDVERVRQIRNLMDDLGVNLAGVEVVMNLLERLRTSEADIQRLTAESEDLRKLLAEHRR